MALQDELRTVREGGAAATRVPARRWDLLAAWAVMLLPLLAFAVIVLERQRVGDLEARLVREVNALLARSNPRPVHAGAPVAGAVGDLARPHLPPIDRAAKRLEGDLGLLREVVAGTVGVKALPAAALATVEELGPDLDGLLAATHAARADFPDDLAWDGAPWNVTWQSGALLAGVRVRLRLAQGDARGAARDGLDVLALGRDIAVARGLVGRMVGVAIVNRATPAVAAAVDALPGMDDRRAALQGLRRIRDAVPPFSSTLRDEFTWTQLYMGQALPPRVRAALDPRALRAVGDGLASPSWWERLLIRDGWRDLRRAQDGLIAAADLPQEQRTAAWSAVVARTRRHANPAALIALPDYGRYARRTEGAARRLEALVLAAATGAFRDVHGRWPASVAELTAAGELQPAEAARLAEAEIAVEPAAGCRVIVPLPQVEDSDPDELRLTLGGSAR